MKRTLPAVGLVALLVGGLPGFASGADEPSKDQKRLGQVARYLKGAARDVFGEKEASKASFPAEEQALWEHARKVHAALYGEAKTKDEVDRKKKSIGALENVTFALMKEIYGPEWYKEWHKIPGGD